MENKKRLKFPAAALCLCLWSGTAPAGAADAPCIIPEPQKIETGEGVFQLQPDRSILGLFAHGGTIIMADDSGRPTAEFLAKKLRQSTGSKIRILSPGAEAVKDSILITSQGADSGLGEEGYELSVKPEGVVIRAPHGAGLFYGAQTLLQLFPPEVFSTNVQREVNWQIPCVQVTDWPRFKWRGFMLDVSRHFFNKVEVKTVLDLMAMHKLNTFHWHLVDDQGWRIEIKKYPRLTQVGAWRASVGFHFPSNATTAYGPDGRYGGYYTQADIREIVRYAAARHITVLPEIEMPGHSTAALTAYPEYGCAGGKLMPMDTDGDYKAIYDPANEGTYKFLEDILTEVIPLFPGKYIHIGGDEVPKEIWKNSPDCQALMKREGLKNAGELQAWFTRRMETIIKAHGRTMMGWSEILQGDVDQDAAGMDWTGNYAKVTAAGHDVVMTLPAYDYFDFYQSSNKAAEPKAADWGGPLTLGKVYSFDPAPASLSPESRSHILGTQGNLWTEEVPSFSHLEYMVFPRACALAEVAWSSQSSRDWDGFMRRLRVQALRFDQLGVNYRHAAVETPEPNPLK